jgi:hypothetical protein
MKKRTFKKVLHFGILLFGISLLLWNCEKEEFGENIVLEETASNYHSRIIALDDIYDVKKHLDDLMPQNSSNKSSEIEGAIFDQDHVLEVIDTLQNTNYSLRFTYPDTPLGEFYNLVIGRTPEGELKTPFVLKYTCDDNFLEDYIAHDFNMYYFKGMVKMHVYTDFFSVDAFSRTTGSCPPELDAVGDPVACEQAPIDGSDTSGGGGDGGNYGNPNSNPGNDSGGTGGFNITITDGDCLCHSTHAAGGCTHPIIVIIISGAGDMQRSVNTNMDDCPSCADANTDGGIGVNEPSMESMRVDLMHRLKVNDSNQINWVNDDMNNQNVIDIISFLNLHTDPNGNDTLHAINFAQSAVEALMNNGEVDFGEEVILDADFINIECLYSVYNDMGQAPTFNNYLQNFNSEKSVADLRLSADNNFGDSNQDYLNAMAITNPPLSSNEIVITFNADPSTSGNILTKPDVFKAVAMIHEIIHADMYRKMLDAVRDAEISGDNLNWTTWNNPIDFENFVESLQNKYFGIFDFYTRFEWNTSTPSGAQHQLMAEQYRNIIKQALTDYDPTLTEEQKEALSWIGLNEANIVAWQNLTQPERDVINQTITQIQNTFPNGC